MLSGPCATIFIDMNAAPQPVDAARQERALVRLQEACELVGRRTAVIEERRVEVRKQLEDALGPDLTSRLLTGLASAA